MTEEFPFFLAGQPVRTDRRLEVRNPFDNNMFAATSLAGDDEFERAAASAVDSAEVMRRLPAYERAAILAKTSAAIKRERESIATTLAKEAGKPIKDALIEADRAVMTFHVASEEARRIGGEVIPMDLAEHGKGRFALTRRFPIGPVAAISPFNFPLNLTAHKLAPAVAAGNPIVLKPATKTPLSALNLARLLLESGLPPGAISVLPMERKTGDRLVSDERFKLLTFTGSSPVGWGMKARAGKKRVILELGGNAGVIVDDSADLELAAKRISVGGFAFSGQSCISVQRVYVHSAVYDAFALRLTALVKGLKIGDPLDPATDLGPMIDAGEAERIDTWVREAVASGAQVVTGGRRLGDALYEPTILSNVPADAKVCAQEAFAPLVVLARFTDFNDALREINRLTFGLQAGVFTGNLERALRAFDEIETGGVIINDVPTYRIDHMPYGGVKDSGLGREGPRYTIEEMTELKLLVINRP